MNDGHLIEYWYIREFINILNCNTNLDTKANTSSSCEIIYIVNSQVSDTKVVNPHSSRPSSKESAYGTYAL